MMKGTSSLKVLFLFVTVNYSFCADIEISFDKKNGYCPGDKVVITANYVGTETVLDVRWVYENQISGSSVIEVSDCKVTVESGFPADIKFTCESKTSFSATLESVAEEVLETNWGVVFFLQESETTKQETKLLMQGACQTCISGASRIIYGVWIGIVLSITSTTKILWL